MAEQQSANLSEQSKVLDKQGLMERYQGREAFVEKLLRLAESEYQNSVSQIRQVVEQGDFSELRVLAHTLKGMSGNIMAHQLRETALKVETLANDRNESAFSESAHLIEAMERLLAELKTVLAENN